MSQAVITKAFSEWKAQQAINNQPVTLDEFIFAYIPGLDADKPIDNTETTPAADKVVYRQVVSKSGVVNENSVVYSVTLGADVGDFDFNWIGLANKATGTLAMIIHAPTQRKIKNANGQQGNVLVRSMLMEYSGAREATEITTPAETWQIDFTARLAAMDERQRRENIDLYGAAAFFDSGYLVAKSGNQFFVTKGAGYVAGLRAELPADLNITASAKPTKVWLDVSWTGTLTSEWAVQSKITVAADLADYVLGGVQHYVFAVASIDAAGNITDLRPKGTLNDQAASDALRKHEQSRNHPDATTSEKGFTQLSSATDSVSEGLAATSKAVKIAMDNANARLAKERNGADILNPHLFVQNIGLQDTVNKAAGAIQKDQNGADIPNTPLFVKNIGLQDTVNKAAGALQKDQNGADIPSKINFRENIGLIIGSAAGNVVTSGSNQPVYKTELAPIGYNELPPAGLFANAPAVADSVTKIQTTFLSKSGDDGWGLGMSLGTYLGVSGAPDELAHVLICSDGGGFTRRWYFYNNGKCVGPSGEFALQEWVSRQFLKLDGATFAGFALNDVSRPYIRHKDSDVVVELQRKNQASLAVNGWSRDGSTGKIEMWGTIANIFDDTPTIVNFPTAFPNACLSFTVSLNRSIKTADNYAMLSVWGAANNNSSATVIFQSNNTGADARSGDISWRATGY
ncbi:TPA: phage tail protein [Citrobacter freundii]